MRTIIGAVAGALATGVMLIAYNSNAPATSAAPDGARVESGAYASAQPQLIAGRVSALGERSLDSGATVVTCEPEQRAIVRRSAVQGQEVSEVQCVGATPSYVDQFGRPVQVIRDDAAGPSGGNARIVRTSAIYPVAERTETVRRPAYRPTTEHRIARRSWQKSAIIIGSTAGAGAGVGALVGGRKGALLGAAIGGGAATVYDQVTRRR